MTPKEPKQPIRVSPSQAANLFGVSEKTIRRAIGDGDLKYIVVRNVYKIGFESLLKWSQSRPKVRNKFNADGIGQYLENEPKTKKWNIKNRLYSPSPETAENIIKNRPTPKNHEEKSDYSQNLSTNDK